MTDQIQITEIEEALANAEIAEILAAEEPSTLPVADIAAAVAEANGVEAALNQAADEAATQAPAADEDDADTKTFAELVDAVTDADVTAMQGALAAAFAERATFEHETNPGNDNIQKTLSKVQKGHLAHGISKAMRAIGLDPNYLNKSEVAGKRRNVYALQKLQDLIYGASSGHVKNAINLAVLVSMIRCERAGVHFTGLVAKACASDKIGVNNQLKGLLKRVHPRFFHSHPALVCLHFLLALPISLR